MVVALDQAGPLAHDLREPRHVVVLRPHAAARPREHVLGARRGQRVLEVRHELRRDRQRVDVPALRRRAQVRALDRRRHSAEVDVALLEREELALAEPEVERGREDVAPLRRDVREEDGHLVRLQGRVRALVLAARLDRFDRIRSVPETGLRRPAEGPQEHTAKVVDGVRPEAVALHLPETLFDLHRRDAHQRELAERVILHVQPEAALLADETPRRTLLAQPPVTQIAERHLRIAGQRLEALALPFRLPLEVERKPLRLRLRARGGALVVPAAGTARTIACRGAPRRARCRPLAALPRASRRIGGRSRPPRLA